MNKPELKTGHYMYYIPADAYVKGKGYRVSIVAEDQPGHYPTGGNDTEPWFWGYDLDEAQQACRTKNAELGLSETDQDRILASSMRQAG